MSRNGILSTDTVLYSHMEPEGRRFLAGEAWPGDAWSERPGGKPVGGETTTQAMKDLVAAQDQNEALGQRIESLVHDLAQSSKAREEAEGALAGQAQALRDVQRAKEDAEAQAREAVKERDSARAGEQAARDRAAKAEDEAKASKETVERLTGDLASAEQAAATANGRAEAAEKALADAKAEIAKVDGDGNGKPGGSKKKAADAGA